MISGILGNPVKSISARNPAATPSALGLAKTWPSISSPRFFLLLERVTIRPAASEVTNAGQLAHQAVADRQLGVELQARH